MYDLQFSLMLLSQEVEIWTFFQAKKLAYLPYSDNNITDVGICLSTRSRIKHFSKLRNYHIYLILTTILPKLESV